jgi:hypothetical protein
MSWPGCGRRIARLLKAEKEWHLEREIHRHGDLHAAVIARAGQPPTGTTTGTQVSW